MTKILIGKVYANWCGHCISLKPEWKRMKSHIKKYFRHIQFIEAESSQINRINNLKRRYNIVAQGYPTIFKIRENGQIEYYDGPRYTNDLIKWAIQGNNRTRRRYMGGRRNNRTRSNRRRNGGS